MSINTSKVVIGGLAAGVIMNVSGFVVQGMLLGKRMEAEMYKRARNLEFEEAARLRDAIEKMKQQELGLNDPNLLTG